jgi:dynactin 1
MIEELAQKNADLGDRVEELTIANEELEGLQQVNDEIELDHVEYEKQMQQELDDKDALLARHARHLREQAEINEENEYTIARYKEIVKTLQSDLEDIRTSHQILGAEAEDTSTRSRAMLDVNLKLQASARKSQANHLDMELRKLDAQEATELLKIVKPFLPEGYLKCQDSVSALLRVRRVGFKAHLLHESVKERMNSKTSAGGYDEDTFAAVEILDRLTWVEGMSRRFVNHISAASVEQFGKFEGALYDLEPVERALTGWIDGLRGDELKERQCATELQRYVATDRFLPSVMPSSY